MHDIISGGYLVGATSIVAIISCAVSRAYTRARTHLRNEICDSHVTYVTRERANIIIWLVTQVVNGYRPLEYTLQSVDIVKNSWNIAEIFYFRSWYYFTIFGQTMDFSFKQNTLRTYRNRKNIFPEINPLKADRDGN